MSKINRYKVNIDFSKLTSNKRCPYDCKSPLDSFRKISLNDSIVDLFINYIPQCLWDLSETFECSKNIKCNERKSMTIFLEVLL